MAQPGVDAPYAILEAARARDRPAARAQSLALHLHRHADLFRGRGRGRGDRSRAPICPSMSRRSSPRSAGGGVVAIACTHTHRDHSPASRALAAATGAPIVGCAPLALDSVGPRADASFDFDYRPDRVLARWRGDRGRRRRRSSRSRRPGHTSNHLVLRLSRGAVHRRPCHGLVDHGGGAARRRHGRLYGEPRQAARSATTASIIPRTARR